MKRRAASQITQQKNRYLSIYLSIYYLSKIFLLINKYRFTAYGNESNSNTGKKSKVTVVKIVSIPPQG
jgi:hypothetical protein